MKIEIEKQAFSVPEAALYLGISLSTAREAIRSGEIPSVRFGRRRVLVPVAALKGILEAATNKPA